MNLGVASRHLLRPNLNLRACESPSASGPLERTFLMGNTLVRLFGAKPFWLKPHSKDCFGA